MMVQHWKNLLLILLSTLALLALPACDSTDGGTAGGSGCVDWGWYEAQTGRSINSNCNEIYIQRQEVVKNGN